MEELLICSVNFLWNLHLLVSITHDSAAHFLMAAPNAEHPSQDGMDKTELTCQMRCAKISATFFQGAMRDSVGKGRTSLAHHINIHIQPLGSTSSQVISCLPRNSNELALILSLVVLAMTRLLSNVYLLRGSL